MQPMMKRPSFSRDRSGNFAVITALVAIPLILAIGGASDIGRQYVENTRLRDSLDAAAIAGIFAPPGKESEVARSFFLANMGSAAAAYELTAEMKGEDVLTIRATGSIDAPFLSLARIDKLPLDIGVDVTRPKVSSVTFTPTNAQGWFSKDIFVFTKDRRGNVMMMKPVISYDYDQKTKTATILPPLNVASATYKLGTSYDTFGVGMTTWKDYNNKGRKDVVAETYYSDASDAPQHILRTGDCLTTESNHWEDGGNDDYRDFEYKVTCQMDAARVRLTQ
jgi:hypothetical protein